MWELHLSTVDSTNSLAKFLLANGMPGPIAISADRQTAGRGSHERKWHSDQWGGLYYSLAVSGINFAEIPDLTIRVARTCSQVVRQLYGIDLQIEWPNDLILDGKKLGGILTEMVTGGANHSPHGIIGIGLNVNQQTFPDWLRPVAISLIQRDGVYRSLIPLKQSITKELLAWL